jgi:hypothetical protein
MGEVWEYSRKIGVLPDMREYKGEKKRLLHTP